MNQILAQGGGWGGGGMGANFDYPTWGEGKSSMLKTQIHAHLFRLLQWLETLNRRECRFVVACLIYVT